MHGQQKPTNETAETKLRHSHTSPRSADKKREFPFGLAACGSFNMIDFHSNGKTINLVI